MEAFFTFDKNMLPQGAGFSLYGIEHLLFLVGIAIAVTLVCVGYRSGSPAQQQNYRRVLACVCLALELGKQALILLLLPAYPVEQLPLHLCGLGAFVQMADAFVPRWHKTTREILYSLSLPGAVAALLFVNWTDYPIASFYCLQSFSIHAVLVCYPAMLLSARQLRPNWRALWRPALFVLIIAVPLYFFNKQWNTNFLFINGGSPGSPLEPLEKLMGNPAYLIGYVGLLAMVWLALYAPFLFQGCKRRRGKTLK